MSLDYFDMKLLDSSERIAVWTFRASDTFPFCSNQVSLGIGPLCEFQVIAKQFQAILEMLRCRNIHLAVGTRATLTLTRHERRLLRATAAAQADDADLVDNYLYKVVAERSLRASLTRLIDELAATLATQGYWLPQPSAARRSLRMQPFHT